jgi:type IV secretory pathway VirB3-like protein
MSSILSLAKLGQKITGTLLDLRTFTSIWVTKVTMIMFLFSYITVQHDQRLIISSVNVTETNRNY